MTDLFSGTQDAKPIKERKKRKRKAHVCDAGQGGFEFECKKCGWNSGWLDTDMTITQAKCGIPCDNCNT